MHPLQKLALEIMQEQGDEFVLTKPLHEYLPGERPERKGADIGSIYIFSQEDIDNYSVGDCWMKTRLKPGDICMCIKHSGDCFNTYILLEDKGNGIKGISGSAFGAYVLCSDPLKWRPSEEEYEALVNDDYVMSPGEKFSRHPLMLEVEGLA